MSLDEVLAGLHKGMAVAELLRVTAPFGELALQPGGDPVKPLLFYGWPAAATRAFVDEGRAVVTSVRHDRGFTGSVRGARIGMTSGEILRLLGEPHRTWPMPHPDIIMIYDRPSFLRLDLSRSADRVTSIFH
jgi:hypothetical protein